MVRGMDEIARVPCYIRIAPISRWRGGRVVEGAALEMLYRGNSIEGSNPSSPFFHTGPRRLYVQNAEV